MTAFNIVFTRLDNRSIKPKTSLNQGLTIFFFLKRGYKYSFLIPPSSLLSLIILDFLNRGSVSLFKLIYNALADDSLHCLAEMKARFRN